MDENLNYRFISFQNETNSCWLDASLSLIVHNRIFKKIVELSPDSQINKIIYSYTEAINTLNISKTTEMKKKSKAMLKELQINTLEYLEKYLNFKSAEPDSAVCALLGLIYHDKSNIKEQLSSNFIWKKHCTNCDTNSQYTTYQKPVITLPKVINFNPECPSSFYKCTCKSEQEMELIYKELPPCLIFHFENGAGTGSQITTSFSIKGREYQLTGIVILEKSFINSNVNHFFTLIRNPFNNYFLELNDLNKKCESFSPIKPKINLKNVYMYVFEAFDNLGKIINYDALADPDQQVENPNVEVVDLSDNNDGSYNTDTLSETSESKSHKFITDDEASKDKYLYSKVYPDLKECSVNLSKCNISIHDIKDTYAVFKHNPDKEDEYNREKIKMDLNECKFVKSNSEKRVEIKDNNSNKKEKTGIDDKCVTSNQESDDQATTSVKSSEKTNEKLMEESNDTNSDKKIREEFQVLVDKTIDQTLANFFAQVYKISPEEINEKLTEETEDIRRTSP